MRRALGLTGSGLLTAGLIVGIPATAEAANCSGGAFATQNTANTTIDCPKTETKDDDKQDPPKRRTSTGARPACVWVPEPNYQPGVGQPVDGKGGRWYRKFCHFGDYDTLADFQRATTGWDFSDRRQQDMMQRAGLDVQYFTTPPPIARPTPEQVMASVADGMPWPDTYIAVNPVATKQVIGVPTWVWLTNANGTYSPAHYQPPAQTNVLQGYPLKWQIVPQLTLTPGDTAPEQSCTGTGVPWSAAADGDPGACTVTYDRTGKYALTANVGWTLRWWLDGVPQNDIPGPTRTATQAVTVLEVQTLTR